jgi:predicted enzyme related to lactoylglutathione lyase
MANVLNWFEIPVTDMARATKFYETILAGPVQKWDMEGFEMAVLPMEGDGVGGAICKGEWYKPTQDGVLVYLNGGADLSNILNRIEGAGGKITVPKTKITDEIGYFAIFIDSEGNRVGLHSQK